MIIKKKYKLLGLKYGESADAIKKAYRKKVMRIHPDRNPSPNAEEEFIELTTAYEVLLQYKEGKYREPSVQQAAYDPEAYKRTTYYKNSRYTIEEMERAWARAKERAQKEYDDYMALPWYSAEKLGNAVFKWATFLVILILLLPLFILSILFLLSKLWLGAFLIGAMTIGLGIKIVKSYFLDER